MEDEFYWLNDAPIDRDIDDDVGKDNDNDDCGDTTNQHAQEADNDCSGPGDGMGNDLSAFGDGGHGEKD